MEKSLEKHMTNVLNNHGVTGITCVDQNGLCLGVKGSGEAKSAGTLAAIGKLSQKLLPDMEAPVVSIESTATNVLIKSHKGHTTAIYKQT
ncbi:ragulator complex protein LAMTOR5 homolog [Watersipora subatra]|uniref:ragulator complex protein LAMTOR5 homolog n=1 Tax=Watersipora subatra TaxID=2589382 RepID=UPI00355C69AB